MLERLAIDRGAILVDPERVTIPGELLFDPAHWHAQGALREQSGGRGSIQFIDNEDHSWVMRRYLRGGGTLTCNRRAVVSESLPFRKFLDG